MRSLWGKGREVAIPLFGSDTFSCSGCTNTHCNECAKPSKLLIWGESREDESVISLVGSVNSR